MLQKFLYKKKLKKDEARAIYVVYLGADEA